MGRISAKKNVDFEGSPTMGGFQPGLRPLRLRGLSDFPILRAYGDFPKVIRRVATSDGAHVCQKVDFECVCVCVCGGGPPTVGGIQSDFRHLQLRGIFAFPILWIYGDLKE